MDSPLTPMAEGGSGCRRQKGGGALLRVQD